MECVCERTVWWASKKLIKDSLSFKGRRLLTCKHNQIESRLTSANRCPSKPSNPNTRRAVRPTSRSKPANVATTVSTYAGERTLLTGHYRNMPHRDKPDPMTYQHSSSPPSCTLDKSLPARSIAGARSSPPPFEHTPE
ncbi:hypothetical protein YC2023_068676 [Brassica napus]